MILSKDDVFAGKWAVVFTAGERRFIGRIVKQEGQELILNPVYDYLLQLMQNGQQIGKSPLVLPFDLCSEQVNLHVRPTAVVYFEDMAESDRKVYQELVKAAISMNETAKRAKNSGIQIAKNLPPSMGR